MQSPARRSGVGLGLMIVLVMVAIIAPINSSTLEKLDESSVPGTPDSGVKCTACSSCENPCNQHPPPPPPSPPPPPKSPSKQYCPPPPPPPFYYITGPPGNLYPYDPYFSSSCRNSVTGGLPFFVGCGLLGLLAFWRLL